MGGIRPNAKVAYIDALATADEKRIYFHLINRSFEEPMNVTVDVSAFNRLEDSAVHHVLEGRLNDAPKADEPRQIGRITQKDISFDGKTLTVTLPHRSVSCIEFTRK
jgi:alpha-L-arabinofuranosidase